MQAHWNRSKAVMAVGERLLPIAPSRDDVQRRISALQTQWEELRSLTATLGRWLRDADQAQQYFQVLTTLPPSYKLTYVN